MSAGLARFSFVVCTSWRVARPNALRTASTLEDGRVGGWPAQKLRSRNALEGAPS